MARSLGENGGQIGGFPRPRGDGPPLTTHSWRFAKFSPPTRGWPGETVHCVIARRVFPAHAGMARDHEFCVWLRECFPRPRGDGPTGKEVIDGAAEFSPPTRGWPGSGIEVREVQSVFPAHAGMARRIERGLRDLFGFPRPRGDGPKKLDAGAMPEKFSPPTRGWPAWQEWQQYRQGVFPAHAGMAREAMRPMPRKRRFPRPRGDGPHPS